MKRIYVCVIAFASFLLILVGSLSKADKSTNLALAVFVVTVVACIGLLLWRQRSGRNESRRSPRFFRPALEAFERRVTPAQSPMDVGPIGLPVSIAEQMEELQVILISDAVAPAEQVKMAATKDAISVVYDSANMSFGGFVDLLASISADHGDLKTRHLAAVVHGGPAAIQIGLHDTLNVKNLSSHARDFERLQALLTVGARFDLYACSVAAGQDGKAFVDELSAVTGASVFASDDPVGTVPGADLVWEYQTGQAAAGNELFPVQEIGTIQGLCLTARTEPTTIRVLRTATNQVQVVSFNDYVRNVLPNEWPSGYGWPPEAYKAGAESVKMYAWKQIEVRMGNSYDVRDDDFDQVYEPNSAAANTDAAVQAVRNVGMEIANGQLFLSQYWDGACDVAAGGANLRPTPGTSGTPITFLAGGTRLYVIDNGEDVADGYRWFQVAVNGVYPTSTRFVGYVAAHLLTGVSIGTNTVASMAGRESQYGTVFWANQGWNYQQIQSYFYNGSRNTGYQNVAFFDVSTAAPDTTTPTVNISSPSNGQTFATSSITVSGTATDAGGSGLSHVIIVNATNNNSGNQPLSGNSSPFSISGITLVPGSNLIGVQTFDQAGNSSTPMTVTVTYNPPDTTPPTVTISSPTNGQTLATSAITVSGTATDAGGSGLSHVIVVNATNNSSGNQLLSGNSSPFSVAGITLVPGSNLIGVQTFDLAGNSSTPMTVTVTYNPPDTTPPTVTISSPTNGQTLATSAITVSGTATDAGGSGLSHVIVVNATNNSSGNQPLSGNSSPFSISGITLVPGSNLIGVQTFDQAGNSSTPMTVTVTYNPPDTTPPTVTISSPTNGQTLATSAITVSGTATDAGGSGLSHVIVVNATNNSSGNQLLSGNSSPFSVAGITLVPGSNLIGVQTFDLAGNSSTPMTVTVTYNPPDTTPPTVTISSPTNGQTLATSAITVSGTATDAGGSGLSHVIVVNATNNSSGNQLLSGNSSPFSVAGITLVPGSNLIGVQTFDLAGNSSTPMTVTVTYNPPDTTPPTVTISSPTNGQTLATSAITVSGTATDAGGSGLSHVIVVNATNNSSGNQLLSGNSSPFSVAGITLVPGSNLIGVQTFDLAGNSSTPMTVTVTYNPPDTTAPAVVIGFPATNATLTSASVTVTGTASDSGRGNNGISSVTVNGLSASGGTASGANSANWSATITLNPGPNTISVVAKDAFNNSGQQQITVTSNPPDTTPPTTRYSGNVSANVGSNNLSDIDVFLQRISADGSILPIQSNIQTWVIIHGLQREATVGYGATTMVSLASAIDAYKSTDQVLVLDWTEGASDNHAVELFLDGAAWIPHVADWAEHALTNVFNIPPAYTFLVGHSWGTFVAFEIAARLPSLAKAIVALDPASAAIDYDNESVNYSSYSEISWAFYGDGEFGDDDRAETADEAFVLSYQGQNNFPPYFPDHDDRHIAPVNVFSTLVRDKGAHRIGELFSLSRLERGQMGPWTPNRYSDTWLGNLQVFEARLLVADRNGDDTWGETWPDIVDLTYQHLTDGHTEVINGLAFSTTLNVKSELVVTSTGFIAHFNKAFDPASLNLYDAFGAFGVCDVVLAGPAPSSNPIRGTLIINDTDDGFTFIRSGTGTGGVLAAGTYTVTIRSAANGFKDLLGGLLDGDSDALPGDNFTTTFVVDSTPAVVLSIPDLGRGPDGATNIKVPNNSPAGSFIPVTLTGASSVTSVSFNLSYDPALLTISGASNGTWGTFTLVSNSGGVASFSFSGATVNGTATLGHIIAQVPTSAATTYKVKQLLSLSGITSVGASAKPTPNNAVHAVAYFGDASGDGSLSAGDASFISRVSSGFDSGPPGSSRLGGFAAYPLLDPVIVADLNSGRTVDGTDVTLIMSFLSGTPRPQIPIIPSGLGPTAPKSSFDEPTLLDSTPVAINGAPLATTAEARQPESGTPIFIALNDILRGIAVDRLDAAVWALAHEEAAGDWERRLFQDGCYGAMPSVIAESQLNPIADFAFRVRRKLLDKVWDTDREGAISEIDGST